jgi:cytochrome c oxidase assembly protein subunit 15
MDGHAMCRYQAGMATVVNALTLPRPGRRAVGWWLVAVALLIAAMVVVGGLTRLTGSGLSITEWHPVTGIVPPLSEQAWQSEFAKYQHIPQYQLEHRGMSLSDFKAIYWWEWTHRLLGRLIGFVFLLPFLYFAATRAIPRAGIPRMVLLFALGGLQGFVGWWMVESGLETRISVSQYRLAIHLGVALILFAAILWTALEYLRDEAPRARGRAGNPGFAFVALVYVQMLLGALVAGLHAGLVYNTWPSMNGHVFPEDAFFSKPWWINFFENAGLAQFDHRLGAYLITAGAVWLWIRSRGNRESVRASANTVLAVTALQVVLGIATLLNQAPVALAALHQATAVALLSAALWHAFDLSRAPQAAAST